LVSFRAPLPRTLDSRRLGSSLSYLLFSHAAARSRCYWTHRCLPPVHYLSAPALYNLPSYNVATNAAHRATGPHCALTPFTTPVHLLHVSCCCAACFLWLYAFHISRHFSGSNARFTDTTPARIPLPDLSAVPAYVTAGFTLGLTTSCGLPFFRSRVSPVSLRTVRAPCRFIIAAWDIPFALNAYTMPLLLYRYAAAYGSPCARLIFVCYARGPLCDALRAGSRSLHAFTFAGLNRFWTHRRNVPFHHRIHVLRCAACGQHALLWFYRNDMGCVRFSTVLAHFRRWIRFGGHFIPKLCAFSLRAVGLLPLLYQIPGSVAADMRTDTAALFCCSGLLLPHHTHCRSCARLPLPLSAVR